MRQEQAPGPQHGTGPDRVLVVDDNRLSRMTLARSVEAEGHRVTLASGGREALTRLRDEPHDVVLLDIVMPDVDGFAVLDSMKADAELKAVPVIVISALDDLDSVVRAIRMGAEDYLPKPAEPVILRARLEACLRRKRLRDLEQAYLRQSVALRQSEKLATLGRLAAGMAHELNNPAASAVRGADQASRFARELMEASLTVAATAEDASRIEALRELWRRVAEGASPAAGGSALAVDEATDALEATLGSWGVERAWEAASALTAAGVDAATLEEALGDGAAADPGATVAWVAAAAELLAVLRTVAGGARRISEIVDALKRYSFLDQAPAQRVDLGKGLEDTLTMLAARLREQGVVVRRELADDVPPVDAFGRELNQVWTHLIDNALGAMPEGGTLTVRAWADGDEAVVEVEDDGVGIPQEHLPNVFDPFFTTKAPGEGMGLGLNISHEIVVQRHGGSIHVASELGATRITVRLPVSRG